MIPRIIWILAFYKAILENVTSTIGGIEGGVKLVAGIFT